MSLALAPPSWIRSRAEEGLSPCKLAWVTGSLPSSSALLLPQRNFPPVKCLCCPRRMPKTHSQTVLMRKSRSHQSLRSWRTYCRPEPLTPKAYLSLNMPMMTTLVPEVFDLCVFHCICCPSLGKNVLMQTLSGPIALHCPLNHELKGARSGPTNTITSPDSQPHSAVIFC